MYGISISDAQFSLLGQTVWAISPNLARAIGSTGTLAWVNNAPRVFTSSQTGVSIAARLFNVSPCLFALSQNGVQINTQLIQVSPRVIQVDAWGVQIQPELITVDPVLINVGPQGIAASVVNVNASPAFITVSPTVKIVPNSNKAPTLSAGIAIKPNPDPATVTNAWGKVVATTASPGNPSGK
jgi:hypothetical protein